MAPDTPEQTQEQLAEAQQQTVQQATEAAQAAQHAAAQAHLEASQAHAAAQGAAAVQQGVAVQAGNAAHGRSFLGKLLNKPTEYDGRDRFACNTFLAQVKLYMSGNEESFPTEETKVLFAATYLRGKAFGWLEPRLVKQTDPILHNFELFCSELQRNLGDPDQEATMVRKLKSIRQTTSAATYRSEFDSITQYLAWDKHALKSYYYDGLRADVKDAISLIPDPPTDFKDYQDLTIKIDTRLYERRLEGKAGIVVRTGPSLQKAKPSRPSYRPPPPRPSPRPNYNPGAPMDLDASGKGGFKPLTPSEREHRISNNLCLYCGQSGHRAFDCPLKRTKKPFKRIHAVLTGPNEHYQNNTKN